MYGVPTGYLLLPYGIEAGLSTTLRLDNSIATPSYTYSEPYIFPVAICIRTNLGCDNDILPNKNHVFFLFWIFTIRRSLIQWSSYAVEMSVRRHAPAIKTLTVLSSDEVSSHQWSISNNLRHLPQRSPLLSIWYSGHMEGSSRKPRWPLNLGCR